MSPNVYEELAAQFGVTVNYVSDLARTGRLHELTGAGARADGNRVGLDDVEQGIYERAKRLEQIRQTMSEPERAQVYTEARMARWLREEVYDVQRGR
jgi:hypothetical protein